MRRNGGSVRCWIFLWSGSRGILWPRPNGGERRALVTTGNACQVKHLPSGGSVKCTGFPSESERSLVITTT